MGRGVNVGKRQAWSERFRRFSELGVTVAEFCDWEGVSVATFYNWRRKCDVGLIRRDSDAGSIDPPRLQRASFLPVRMIAATPAPSGLQIEIVLTNGVRVLVPTNDGVTVRRAIIAAGRILPATEHSVC
jgi:hypothetical protein